MKRYVRQRCTRLLIAETVKFAFRRCVRRTRVNSLGELVSGNYVSDDEGEGSGCRRVKQRERRVSLLEIDALISVIAGLHWPDKLSVERRGVAVEKQKPLRRAVNMHAMLARFEKH